jgi:hypothetical protein
MMQVMDSFFFFSSSHMPLPTRSLSLFIFEFNDNNSQYLKILKKNRKFWSEIASVWQSNEIRKRPPSWEWINEHKF